MERYERVKQIGEGTFGKVYKSVERKTGIMVAVKKVALDPDAGFPFTTIREIRTLRKLASVHVTALLGVFAGDDSVSLVMEYMEYDLTGLLTSKYAFSDEQVVSLVHQLIEAAKYMHARGVIHRDIKPSNILINAAGQLKIADFSLAREPTAHMTNRVCTLWYRAPELLLGDTAYTEKIDSWSIGCILLELRLGCPFFKGRDEISQAKEIFERLGCPAVEYPWDSLFNAKKYARSESWDQLVALQFGGLYGGGMLRMVGELLRLDKKKRLSAANASELEVVRRGANRLIPIDFTESHELYTKTNKDKIE